MGESKAVIGLSWEPKLPVLSSLTSKTPSASGNSQSEPQKSALWKPNTELVDGLFVPSNDPKKVNKLLRKQLKDTAGKSWFDMPAPTLTPELKKDLQLLKLRSAIDPKRHYKKGDSKSKTLPKYFQVGTIVESAEEFFSNRLTKKERKAIIADELLSDSTFGQYRKRKVREIEEKSRPGGNEKWKIKGQQSRRRAKQRRN
ncbi:Fcf2 domain-containing protein [Cephalotus follicularis]|uniref:Fcf2 domain-containing protein n=1 Tax=Cephalotus follicularis TaxID=3775 RepID=A0A1Q3AXR1_CEPFO|nr:Fcf2 domain-containing protein [Cephalotus follicularis]